MGSTWGTLHTVRGEMGRQGEPIVCGLEGEQGRLHSLSPPTAYPDPALQAIQSYCHSACLPGPSLGLQLLPLTTLERGLSARATEPKGKWLEDEGGERGTEGNRHRHRGGRE